jgi:hypothetical protein
VEFCAGDLISASKVYNLAYDLEIFLLECFIVVLKDGETGLLKKIIYYVVTVVSVFETVVAP